MAELEVAKHTKNILASAQAKEHGLLEKLKHILIEVAIIIFAVSVSIWFHSWSEHKHEQEKVKTFLLGIKDDMQADMKWLERAVTTLDKNAQAYQYLSGLQAGQKFDQEAFDKAYAVIEVPTLGVPLQRGRYEGFKSSGRLGTIEDEVLAKKVVDIYEYSLFAFRAGEQLHETNRINLKNYLNESVDLKGPSARYDLITSPKGKRLLNEMTWTAASDYRGVIKLERELIEQIDKLYPTASH